MEEEIEDLNAKNDEEEVHLKGPNVTIDENGKDADRAVNIVKKESLDMENNADVKKEVLETKYDAFTDGGSIHRKYRLRERTSKNVMRDEDPAQKITKMEVIDDADESYGCPKCRQEFQSKTGLLNHMRMHQTAKSLTCALCEDTFDTNAELIRHKIVHKDEDRIFLCKICKMAFTDHCDFLIHDIEHSKRPTHKCLECGTYYKPGYIKTHIETHFDRRVECSVCNKKIASRDRLKQHMYIHSRAQEVECGECGKLCKNRPMLNYHMISHTGVKRFQCLYCGQAFAHAGGRLVHTRHHTNERPFSCDICELSFFQATDLNRHILTHAGKNNFKCDFCHKKFTHKESLARHMRVHTGENMINCPMCSKSFQSKQCLRAHVLYVHTAESDFKCGPCDMAFKTKNALTRHEKSKTHLRAAYGKRKMKKEE